MPLHCCVPCCNQRGGKDSDGNKVSFLGFPNDSALKKKWIVAIRRDEGKHFKANRHTKVCSKHFVAADFFSNYVSGTKRLKEGAVPSVFNFPSNPAGPRRKPPKDRGAQNTSRYVQEPTEETHGITEHRENSGTAPEPELLGTRVIADDVEMGNSFVESQAATCTPGYTEITSVGNTEKDLEKELQEVKEELRVTNEKLLRSERKTRFLEDELKHTKQALLRVTRELELAQETLKKLERKVGRQFSVERFKSNDEDMRFYTGLLSYAVFTSVLNFLNPGEHGENIKARSRTQTDSPKMGRPRSLTVENEFFLFLVRLRLGLFEKDLADRFCVSTATVSRICITWTSYAFIHLAQLPLWMSKERVQEEMPPEFKDKYSATRVIIDATEIKCQTASSLALQSATFSTYKSANTFKGLIGISPDGTVTFVSNLFPGSISDKECVRQSGFLTLPFDEGDVVMADKGFRIQEMLNDIKVGLNIPQFLTRGHFSEAEVKETEEIASLRIHVERRIQRVKSFHIFDRPVPLSLGPIINEMWVVCVILTNFQSPLLRSLDD
ncbi:uncharacterized protein LOC135380210 [Ornithodoros turicata]|uniref:uncharacterized protein LOC135380210 n=1 Tax=Ornithodoros turicata TaxID=34597 RepID=UPI00313908F4